MSRPLAHSLGNLPPGLATLTLKTVDMPEIDSAPLLAAWSGRKPAPLRLNLIRDGAPILEPFTSAVAGPWGRTIRRKGWRLVPAARREDAMFDIHRVSAIVRGRGPPRPPSELSADATLLAQVITSACALPALRGLTLELRGRSGPCVPIPEPHLQGVSVPMHAEPDGIVDDFREIQRFRLTVDRALLARIRILATLSSWTP